MSIFSRETDAEKLARLEREIQDLKKKMEPKKSPSSSFAQRAYTDPSAPSTYTSPVIIPIVSDSGPAPSSPSSNCGSSSSSSGSSGGWSSGSGYDGGGFSGYDGGGACAPEFR